MICTGIRNEKENEISCIDLFAATTLSFRTALLFFIYYWYYFASMLDLYVFFILPKISASSPASGTILS